MGSLNRFAFCIFLAVAASGAHSLSDVECSAPEEYLREIGALPAHDIIPSDGSCFKDFSSLDLTGHLLLDIRASNDFQSVHAAGSLNVTSESILHNPRYEKKPFIISGYSDDHANLMQLCGRFKSKGYDDLSIVNGGIRSLYLNGQRLIGDPADIALLEFAKPERAARQLASDKAYLIFDKSAVAESLSFESVDKSALFPLESKEQFNQLFEKLSADNSFSSSRLILVYYPGLNSSYLDVSGVLKVADVNDLAQELRKVRLIEKKYADVPDRYKCKGN